MQLVILGKAINTLNTSKTAYTYFYKKYRIIQNYKSDKNVKPIKASIVNNLDLDLVKNNDSLLMSLSDDTLLKMER